MTACPGLQGRQRSWGHHHREAGRHVTTTVTVEHRVIGPVLDDVQACYATRWEETLASLDRAAEQNSDRGVHERAKPRAARRG